MHNVPPDRANARLDAYAVSGTSPPPSSSFFDEDGNLRNDLSELEMNMLLENLDALAELVEEGLVAIVGVNDKGHALYELTEAGLEALAEAGS